MQLQPYGDPERAKHHCGEGDKGNTTSNLHPSHPSTTTKYHQVVLFVRKEEHIVMK